MYLPPAPKKCIALLQAAGYRAYAVGGCVRNHLLGLIPQDYDLCTSATPQEMCRIFEDFTLVRSGEKHGTIGVVMDGQVVEITTFRTEGGYQDSRHPDWVAFVTDLKEDLARRDFTVNAMAYHPQEGVVDPFGGKDDLAKKVLRAVGDPAVRFTEDPLRILRGVRFAVTYGLTPEKNTLNAMIRLAPLMEHLARERVFSELCKLLPLLKAEDLHTYAPILTQPIPELAASIGFHQHSPYHRYDVYTHTAHVVEATPPDLVLRWAALLHDVEKPGVFYRDETGRGHFPDHARQGAETANEILLRLKAPTALREEAVLLIRLHMTKLEPDKRLLRRRLGKWGEETLLRLLQLQEADMVSKGYDIPEEIAQFPILRNLIREVLEENSCLTVKDLAIDGNDLLQAGFAPGPELGKCLMKLLRQVQDEELPNEKEALLKAAKEN